MCTGLIPIHRKPLVDPAACGVRLGVQLRSAAEQLAWSQGLCLSHWIKRLVEDFVANAKGNVEGELTTDRDSEIELPAVHSQIAPRHPRSNPAFNSAAQIRRVESRQKDALQSALNAAYAEKMEELKP
jgi:hypothetical protein